MKTKRIDQTNLKPKWLAPGERINPAFVDSIERLKRHSLWIAGLAVAVGFFTGNWWFGVAAFVGVFLVIAGIVGEPPVIQEGRVTNLDKSNMNHLMNPGDPLNSMMPDGYWMHKDWIHKQMGDE